MLKYEVKVRFSLFVPNKKVTQHRRHGVLHRIPAPAEIREDGGFWHWEYGRWKATGR